MTAPDSSDPRDAAAEPAARTDVRVVSGDLGPDELSAVAVAVAAMSVTSRAEAAERALTEGIGGMSAWNQPVLTHPRGHALRTQASPTAWQFSDR